MPLWFFPTLLAVSAIVTMVSGIWLLLHLTALARTLAGRADIVPARAWPRVSRRAVRLGLAAFLGGTLVTIATLVLVASGLANALIA